MQSQHDAPGRGYTFGDTDLAARRLEVLGEVFGPSSRALLADVVQRPPGLAYDLGCGPGHTTALVSQVTGARRTVGLDESAAYIERAQASAPAAVDFARHDVRQLPFPAGAADLVFCRLLLAHLADPVAIARSWASQLTERGLLVLDEIEWIEARHPVLQAHLRLAGALVATSGARMCAGPALAGLADQPGLRRVMTRVRELPVATSMAATMFAMNLAALGDRPVTAGVCDRAELSELAAGLAELRDSPETGQISWGMHQAAYARAGTSGQPGS
jgi:SAM-dependent methyltransferase